LSARRLPILPALLLLGLPVQAEEKVLNVYNWTD